MPAISVTLDRDKTVVLRYGAPPPPTHTLTVRVLADSTEVTNGVTVDTTTLKVPGSLTLDEGTYTITAPDSIVVNGVTYNFSGSEEA